MIVGVVRETFPDERRVALVPAAVAKLAKAGIQFVVESGAGVAAGFPDTAFEGQGVRIGASRGEVFEAADVVVQVRTLGANPEAVSDDLALHRSGQAIVGCAEPLTAVEPITAMAERGATLFAMELIPRITRAQSMDVLSSMANLAGYQAVLQAAEALPKMFPMMMTAAGTIKPARVFIIGVGVAGLQAIATARRLGAVVRAYDLRPVVKEQVESLGAKFVELKLEAGDSEDKGGYAKAMDEEFYRRQRELMTEVLSESDVVITTAAIPGKKAPILVTAEMVRAMPPGSVIVDLAAERGGNCELTQPDETVDADGVRILGPTNLPSATAYHASQMYANNVSAFLTHLTADGEIRIDTADEITAETLVCRDGEIVNARVREAFGLTPSESAPSDDAAGPDEASPTSDTSEGSAH